MARNYVKIGGTIFTQKDFQQYINRGYNSSQMAEAIERRVADARPDGEVRVERGSVTHALERLGLKEEWINATPERSKKMEKAVLKRTRKEFLDTLTARIYLLPPPEPYHTREEPNDSPPKPVRKIPQRTVSSREKPVDIEDLIISMRETYGLVKVSDEFTELYKLHNPLDPALYVIALNDLGELKKTVAIPVGTLGRILFLYAGDPREIDLEFYPDLQGTKAIQKFLQDQDDSYKGRRIGHLTKFDEITEEFIILGEYNPFSLED